MHVKPEHGLEAPLLFLPAHSPYCSRVATQEGQNLSAQRSSSTLRSWSHICREESSYRQMCLWGVLCCSSHLGMSWPPCAVMALPCGWLRLMSLTFLSSHTQAGRTQRVSAKAMEVGRMGHTECGDTQSPGCLPWVYSLSVSVKGKNINLAALPNGPGEKSPQGASTRSLQW